MIEITIWMLISTTFGIRGFDEEYQSGHVTVISEHLSEDSCNRSLKNMNDAVLKYSANSRHSSRHTLVCFETKKLVSK